MNEYLRPVYGWATRFTNGYPYTREDNVQGLYMKRPCHERQRDGQYSQSPPFYQIAPYPSQINPIYYNYTLPNNYPYVNGCAPKPSQYWYYPYYSNPCFWDNPLPAVEKS